MAERDVVVKGKLDLHKIRKPQAKTKELINWERGQVATGAGDEVVDIGDDEVDEDIGAGLDSDEVVEDAKVAAVNAGFDGEEI